MSGPCPRQNSLLKAAPAYRSRAWLAPTGSHSQRGFSLVEIIIGMVITAIALTSLTTLLYSQFVRGVDPIFQMRAAELGQALADEILGKAFDETSPLGGNPPCNPCTAIVGKIADADGESRADFDDVDDYNAYCEAASDVIDQAGVNLSADGGSYENFRMQICVVNDDDYDANTDDVGDSRVAKRISVNIFPPSAGQVQTTTPIQFVFYRSNF